MAGPLGPSWTLSGALPGPLRGLWGAQQTPKSRPRAAQERPRAAQEPPKSAQERPKSGQERPKSAQEAPSSPKRLRRLIFGRFGSPFRLHLGSPGASKISKKCRTVVKNQGFRGLARGGRKRPEKAQKGPQDAPRQAQNLPREKTESGVRKSCWCIGWPPRLPRLSGGSTVNLARFPCSGAPAEKVHLSRCPWCLVVSW